MSSDEMTLKEQGEAARRVTPLCMGCSGLGNTTDVSDEQALATIRAFFNSPMNFLDTAAGYGDGASERRIGIVLRELSQRQEPILVTRLRLR